MPLQCHPLISVLFSLLLVVVSFIFQLIALTTTWWATFSADVETGKPKEDGHYGIWSLCSIKAPYWKEDCDPLDTFFKVPEYIKFAGILAVCHLILLVILIPLELTWAALIFRNIRHVPLNHKHLCIAKIGAALFSVILASVIAGLSSIGEHDQSEYIIMKGWSFWLQVIVIAFDVNITILFIVESLRFWKLPQQADPDGKNAETYGNPTFDAESPEVPRRNYITNGNVAFTEASGNPYEANAVGNGECNQNEAASSSNCESEECKPKKQSMFSKHSKQKEKSPQPLTFENESYQEHSPRTSRKEH